MTPHRIYHISNIVLYLLLACLAYVIFLIAQPFQPPELNKPITVNNPNKQLKATGVLSYRLDYCVFKTVPVHNSRRLQSLQEPYRVFYFAETSMLSTKGCKVVDVNFSLDGIAILPGKYKAISEATYKVNPLKTVHKIFETEDFEIVE